MKLCLVSNCLITSLLLLSIFDWKTFENSDIIINQSYLGRITLIHLCNRFMSNTFITRVITHIVLIYIIACYVIFTFNLYSSPLIILIYPLITNTCILFSTFSFHLNVCKMDPFSRSFQILKKQHRCFKSSNWAYKWIDMLWFGRKYHICRFAAVCWFSKFQPFYRCGPCRYISPMQISVVLYCVVYNVQLYVRYAMSFNTVLQSKITANRELHLLH